jgi:hypothetical protein
MLPPLDTPPTAAGGVPGRDIARTREVALQKIVETTAIARVNRAERTRTSAAGEAYDYHPGDLVDYHRPATQKDVSAWHGPARVIKNLPDQGQVEVLPLGQSHKISIRVRYADARRFIDFTGLVFLAVREPSSSVNVIRVIERELEHLPEGRFETIGYTIGNNGSWTLTPVTHRYRKLALALGFFTRTIRSRTDIVAVRIGRGRRRLPSHCGYDSSICFLWTPHSGGLQHAQRCETHGQG